MFKTILGLLTFVFVNFHKTIQVKGKLISFDVPKVMGIINCTPDSFYVSSRKTNEAEIFSQVENMLGDGVDMIDIGAISTRPGSAEVTVDEEKKRLFSVLPKLCNDFPEAVFSIDTFRADVAEEAISIGAAIINDISGGTLDERMVETISRLQVPYVLMHMRGNPQNMGKFTHYDKFPEDVVSELAIRLQQLKKAGANDIILDPGFGFAKTISQNFLLFNHLKHITHLGYPLLVGISRKKTIYQTLGISPEESLNGTTYMHAVALMNGANILRVHDVKAAKQCVVMHQALNNADIEK